MLRRIKSNIYDHGVIMTENKCSFCGVGGETLIKSAREDEFICFKCVDGVDVIMKEKEPEPQKIINIHG